MIAVLSQHTLVAMVETEWIKIKHSRKISSYVDNPGIFAWIGCVSVVSFGLYQLNEIRIAWLEERHCNGFSIKRIIMYILCIHRLPKSLGYYAWGIIPSYWYDMQNKKCFDLKTIFQTTRCTWSSVQSTSWSALLSPPPPSS